MYWRYEPRAKEEVLPVRSPYFKRVNLVILTRVPARPWSKKQIAALSEPSIALRKDRLALGKELSAKLV